MKALLTTLILVSPLLANAENSSKEQMIYVPAKDWYCLSESAKTSFRLINLRSGYSLELIKKMEEEMDARCEEAKENSK